MKKNIFDNSWQVAGIAVVTLIFSIGLGVLINNRQDKTNLLETPQSHNSYSLNLMSGRSYPVNAPVSLKLAINNQTGSTVKDFDTVHEKKLHLIVVRKDRLNFQHVHPQYDQTNGVFTLDSFTFPADGEYRIYADFTPSNGQKNAAGRKPEATPYQDVVVGNISNYTPTALGADKLASSTNGLDTKITFSTFLAKKENVVSVDITKDGQTYKNLQTYLGASGHMVVLGPNLEYIHAHPRANDRQNGQVAFDVSFPEVGRYKLYLQTQAGNIVNTTDYTLTVTPDSSAAGSGTNPVQHNDGH